MQYFAALSLPEFTGFLAVLVGMLTGFYGIAKLMLNQAMKDREADREERKHLTKAIKDMADPEVNGNKRIADGIERQAQESAERNGHLGELIIAQGEQTQKIADTAVKSIVRSVGVQNVKEQLVDHQTVKSKD